MISLMKAFVAIYYIKFYYDHYNIVWVLRIFNWIMKTGKGKGKGESNFTLERDGEWEKVDLSS